MIFQQLRNTLAAREDMEARRVALYQRAGAKAEAASQAARAAQAARLAQDQQNVTGSTTPATTGQSPSQNAGQTAAAQSVPLQPSAAPLTKNSGSPN